MNNDSTGLNSARLERLARAIDAAKALDDRTTFLKCLISNAIEIAKASRGHAILLDGDIVVAESSRTSAGDSYKVDDETRKLAARSGVRLTSTANGKRFAIELHGAKASLAVRIDGRLSVGTVLDRPDLELDPGCGLTAAWLLCASGILRAMERPEVAHSVNSAVTTHAAGGVGAVLYLKTVDELERDAIELALRQTHWKKDEAARKLGISRASIYMKVKKFNLQSPPAE